jgi:hypothetical protein
MTTTLDNRGAMISLHTRAGIDFLFELGVDDAAGKPVDLTGYTVEARIDDDDGTLTELDATISGDTIAVHLPAALTAALPSCSRYSVVLVSPVSAVARAPAAAAGDPSTAAAAANIPIRSSLAYGPISCDRNYPS